MKYRTIVADPPWDYERADGRLPTRSEMPLAYESLSLGDICILPVSDLAERSAHLYLWTTAEHLRHSFAVVGAWGFTYRTTIVWCKRRLGMGATAWRNSAEFILFGERGYVKPQRRDLGTWHEWATGREHSQKPDAFYDLVPTVSPGPYLELFARRQRFGWDTWGNEALEHVELTA